MGWFWGLLLRLYALSGPAVTLLYPLYASVKAIETPSQEDDQQWLTYWILYSFITLLELAAGPVFAWIPLWRTIKLAFTCWLVLPPFRGAAFLYERFVRGELLVYKLRLNQKLNESQRHILRLMSPEARASVEHYIDEYGTDAFDKLIGVATQEAKRNKLSPPKETQERY